MTAIGTISHRGLFAEDFQYAFLLASGITAADIGKAVTIDSTADGTVKLAGDGEFILGRLETVEVRAAEGVSVGTVSTQGGLEFIENPNATSSSPDETAVAGDYISGGTATGSLKGYVNKVTSGTRANKWLVVGRRVVDSVTYLTAIAV